MKKRMTVPDYVHENIDAIVSLRAQEERSLSTEQRVIEELTGFIGQPRSLYALFLGAFIWGAYNAFASRFGVPVFDAPPFFLLQGIVGFYAAVMTTMILVTQHRQRGEEQRNAHLDLQVNLLAEQRTAKIVALLEELRRDLPNVRDRVDPVAEALQEAVPPHAVISAIDLTSNKPT